MKKLLVSLFLIGLIGCEYDDPNVTYTLKYVVFYPNYNDTLIATNHRGFFWSCDRGNNYIKNGSTMTSAKTLYSGSAPYKILSYTKRNENN
jgi:hypothetical protein